MATLIAFIGGTLAGGFIQLAIAIAFEPSFRRYYRKIRSRYLYFLTAITQGAMGQVSSELYSINGSTVNCVVLEGTPHEPFQDDNIIATLLDDKLSLPPDLAALTAATTQRQNDIAESKGHPTFFNGPMVAVQGWSRSRTPVDERDMLSLRFLRTDYYTFLSTAMSLNESIDTEDGPATVRDLHLLSRNYRTPNPHIATSFGVNLALITSDRFAMLGRRGISGLSNYAGRLAVPIGESVHPEFDRIQASQIDLYATAIRGAREELNLDVSREEVSYYSLAVDTTWYFYGLTGAVFSRFSRDDIIARRSIGAKDRWEHSEMTYIGFDPTSIATYIKREGGPSALTPSSFVSLTQALIATYGQTATLSAFQKRLRI